MVHVVLLKGPAEVVRRAEERIPQSSSGWIRLRDGLWLLGPDGDAAGWRDRLQFVGLEVLVMQLAGDWAAVGFPQAARWLQGARHVF